MTKHAINVTLLLLFAQSVLGLAPRKEHWICVINNQEKSEYHVMKPNFNPPDYIVGGRWPHKINVDIRRCGGSKNTLWITQQKKDDSWHKIGEIPHPKENHTYNITNHKLITELPLLLCSR